MFIEAGCELIMVHVESVRHLDRTLNVILNSGAKAGVTLNPSTPIESIVNVLHLVDQVLIMSVNPGFGGQKVPCISRGEDQIIKQHNLRKRLVSKH
ncbi:MAG: hypothetical protein CM15mP49_10290 [Actinomycetota bacterium]|nr:MAG: hypothetical protein CM15mP49_10290 [Actinomycetota bacterium]